MKTTDEKRTLLTDKGLDFFLNMVLLTKDLLVAVDDHFAIFPTTEKTETGRCLEARRDKLAELFEETFGENVGEI